MSPLAHPPFQAVRRMSGRFRPRQGMSSRRYLPGRLYFFLLVLVAEEETGHGAHRGDDAQRGLERVIEELQPVTLACDEGNGLASHEYDAAQEEGCEGQDEDD